MIRILLSALLALFAAGGPAMAVQEPAFTVEAREGAMEIRRYAPLIAAEVLVEAQGRAAANEGFRPLANYIFGANVSRAKIAMTAPVTQTPRSEKIAMTAPVTQTPAGGDAWAVRFIMPAGYTMETLPTPADPRVRLVPEPARRVAAVRFSGGAGERTLAAKTAELEAFLKARGETPAGPATWAFYDPPWTPVFMRRNEVLIPLQPKPA